MFIDPPTPICSTAEVLKGLAAILAAIAWPIVALIALICCKDQVLDVFKVLVLKLSRAKKITSKWINIEEAIEAEVAETEKAAIEKGPSTNVPGDERQAAKRVEIKINENPEARGLALTTVRHLLIRYATEYETIRDTMLQSSPERTRRMNAVMAKMRTISLPAKPLLPRFSHSERRGLRLAAIAILQMSPNANYIDWLADRMSAEDPFVFYNAAIALLEVVRSKANRFPKRLRSALESAKSQVESFTRGTPDQNTIDTLNLALAELDDFEKRRDH